MGHDAGARGEEGPSRLVDLEGPTPHIDRPLHRVLRNPRLGLLGFMSPNTADYRLKAFSLSIYDVVISPNLMCVHT